MNALRIGGACLLAGLVWLTAAGLQAQDARKVNPTGKWTWTSPGRDGATRTNSLTLKLEGDKLTGAIAGRQQDTPIEDAKINGEEISFKVVREFNGNKMVQQFKGKLSADKIVGKMEFDRNGETTSRDWEAKKEAETKK